MSSSYSSSISSLSDDVVSYGKWIARQDKFHMIPGEIRQASRTGGIITIVTYLLLLVLLVAEVVSFMTTTTSSALRLDSSSDKEISIHFAIRMHYLPCKYVRLETYSAFGQEKVNPLDQDFSYVSVDKNGVNRIAAVDSFAAEVTPESSVEEWDKELDSDWASSDDHFKHKSFEDAVAHHEFTLVLFHADWCSHCITFHPTWNSMTKNISMQEVFKNKAGHDVMVKFMKINCVDFADACRKEQIHAYPALRFYTEEVGSLAVPFVGTRSEANIRRFLSENTMRSTLERHDHVMNNHGGMREGCDVRGTITVPRVPGEFRIQATADRVDGTMNPEVTDVSHAIHHLHFGDFEVIDEVEFDGLKLSPLNDKEFAARDVGFAPHHYLKIVQTTVEGLPFVAYQMADSNRLSRVAPGGIPQLKFMYDLSPMSVLIKKHQKPWYEFVTSLFALLGGFYTVMKVSSRSYLRMMASKEE